MTVETLTHFEEVGLNLKGPCAFGLFFNMSDDDAIDYYLRDLEDFEQKDSSGPDKADEALAPVKQEAEALVASSAKLSPKSLSPPENSLEWNENRYFEEALDRFLDASPTVAPEHCSSSVWDTANRELRVMETQASRCKLESLSPFAAPARGLRRMAPMEDQVLRRPVAGAKAGPEAVSLSSGATWQQSIPFAKTHAPRVEKDPESEVAPPLRKRRRASPASPSMKKRSKTLSSKYRGVSKCSKDGRWQARIRIGAVVKYLGRFKSEIEAAKRYDIAAHKLHGERAMPNFAPDGTPNVRTIAQGNLEQTTSGTSAQSDVDTVGSNED